MQQQQNRSKQLNQSEKVYDRGESESARMIWCVKRICASPSRTFHDETNHNATLTKTRSHRLGWLWPERERFVRFSLPMFRIKSLSMLR